MADLGNTEKRDGGKYYGRGYLQCTGRINYTKFSKLLNLDLLNNPDLALDEDISIKISMIACRDGLFTGAKLGKYINKDKKDYYNARRVINYIDKADKIKSYTEIVEMCLMDQVK